MSFNACAFLPSSCCMAFSSVVGLFASDWKAEAALIAAIGFVCVLGLAVRAEEARKEARWKARLEAWPEDRKRRVDPGLVRGRSRLDAREADHCRSNPDRVE